MGNKDASWNNFSLLGFYCRPKENSIAQTASTVASVISAFLTLVTVFIAWRAYGTYSYQSHYDAFSGYSVSVSAFGDHLKRSLSTKVFSGVVQSGNSESIPKEDPVARDKYWNDRINAQVSDYAAMELRLGEMDLAYSKIDAIFLMEWMEFRKDFLAAHTTLRDRFEILGERALMGYQPNQSEEDMKNSMVELQKCVDAYFDALQKALRNDLAQKPLFCIE